MPPRRLVGFGLLAATGLLAGCSGGGSDPQRGATLSVSLMDAPVDGVTEVHVEIASIWLKAEGNGPASQLPLANAPRSVDLLELTEDNAAVLIDQAVIAAGSYEWLALDVNADFDGVLDSYVMTDIGGQEEIRVPSGRVRLVSGFDVQPNQALQLLFDWDTRKGLVLAPGQPGYLLKPAFRVLDVTELGSLSGVIAMSTITDPACTGDDANLDIGNVVYIFAGSDVTPDDVDGIDPEPVALAAVMPNDAGEYVYRTVLMPGDYTAAFTCQAGNDDPEVDETSTPAEIVFVSPSNVTINAAAAAMIDY